MNRSSISRVLVLTLSTVFMFSCGGGGSSGSTTATDDMNIDTSIEDSNASSTQLVSGDRVLFLAKSSSSSDVMNIGGQSVTLESGSGYIYRYVPSIPALERFDRTYNATNNYSCESAGAQKPLTSGQTLFNVEVCPNYGGGYSTVDIEQIDLNSGELVGNGCSLILSGTSQVSIQVTYLNGYLYYVESGGDLKRGLPGCSTPETILTSGDSNNIGRFYGIAGQLISLENDVFYNDLYQIRLHNADSGAIMQSMTQIAVSDKSNTMHSFFEGDDALYWAVYHQNNYTLDIYRYVPSGAVELLYATTLSDAMTGVAIDAGGGEVLISYEHVASRTAGGYATSWKQETRIYDPDQDTVSTLDLNNNFEQSLQFLVYQ